MSLETGTYISDLNAANPSGTDPKSQGDDHLRLLKSTIKVTFPNIAGAVTPTHTELNFVDGVTSAIQTQIDSKGAHAGQTWTGTHDFTGAAVTVATPIEAAADASAAPTGWVDTYFGRKASPAFTGTPTGPTAAPGTNTTQLATTAFATQLAFTAALPVQTGAAGRFITTDGSTASWANLSNLKNAQAANYTLLAADRYKHLVLTGSSTLTLLASATATDGFIFWVRNDGTGVWTIDPNGSETIDGRTSIKVYPGESFAVICDGSNWRCFGRSRRVVISTTTVGVAVAAVDFEIGFDDSELYRLDVDAVDVSLDAADALGVRLKKSGSYQTTGYATDTGGAISGTTTYAVASVAISTASRFQPLQIQVLNPFSAASNGQWIKIESGGPDSGNPSASAYLKSTAFQSAAAAMTGLRVFAAGAANIDAGTFRLIGYR